MDSFIPRLSRVCPVNPQHQKCVWTFCVNALLDLNQEMEAVKHRWGLCQCGSAATERWHVVSLATGTLLALPRLLRGCGTFAGPRWDDVEAWAPQSGRKASGTRRFSTFPSLNLDLRAGLRLSGFASHYLIVFLMFSTPQARSAPHKHTFGFLTLICWECRLSQ